MRKVWEAQEAASRGPQPIVVPPPPTSSQSVVLTNPFSHQLYICTKATKGKPSPPSSHHDYHILMINFDEVNTKKDNI